GRCFRATSFGCSPLRALRPKYRSNSTGDYSDSVAPREASSDMEPQHMDPLQ
ncbi:hypothetical protein KI387_028608, partial [Taxus chinensis]